jgi:hypothetical protein
MENVQPRKKPSMEKLATKHENQLESSKLAMEK